jgi:hypothetical protein
MNKGIKSITYIGNFKLVERIQKRVVPKKKKNPHSRMWVGRFIGLETRSINVRKLIAISLKSLILPLNVIKTAKNRYEIGSTLTDQIGAL